MITSIVASLTPGLTFEFVRLIVYFLSPSCCSSHLDISHVNPGEELHLHHPGSWGEELSEADKTLTRLTYDVSRLVPADVSQQIFEIDVFENLIGILVNNINYLLLCQSGYSILCICIRVRPLEIIYLR